MGGMANGPMGGGLGGAPGGGFLSNLLGGLPDPLGIGKLLGLTGQPQSPQGAPPAPMGPPPPQGVQFAPQPSGVSVNTSQMANSPMGPTGFRVGGG